MASGAITLTAYGKLPSYLNGRIVWSSVSNGTAANTSTVTAQIQISRNSSVATTGTWYGSLNVGGTTKQISYYASVGSSWVTIDTLTATVTHNADGSGSCYIYGVLNGPTQTTLEGTYVSGSATVTMDKIARYASIKSATDFTDEGNPTITYSNPAGTAVSSMQACISLTGSKDDVPYTDIPKTGTTYTFSLSESERNTLRAATPNSNTLQVKAFVRSKIGDIDEAYYVKSTMTIVNANPTVSPSIVDTNSTTIDVTGDSAILVANRSTARVTINASAKKYATIKSRRVEHGTQVLTGDGTVSVTNNPIKITVTDSRGNTAKHTATNTIVPYFNPTCSIGNNMPATDGTFRLVVSGLFYNGSIGKTSNTIRIQYRRKTANGSYGSWTDISSVTKSGNSYTATANFTGLDYQTVYKFQARAIDALNPLDSQGNGGVLSAEKAVISEPVFDWGKNDFQFNVPVNLKDGCDILKNGIRAYAPHGFGLGESAISVTNLNNETNCGWWAFDNTTLNRPFDYGMGMTINRYGSRFAQIAFNPHMDGCGEICVRSHNGTAWMPWEYVNPPLVAGYEYRTTERHGYKIVYAMLVSCGTLPSSGSKSVSTPIPSAANIVSAVGVAVDSSGAAEPIPIINYNGAVKCSYFITSGKNIMINAYSDVSNYTGNIIVKYTID